MHQKVPAPNHLFILSSTQIDELEYTPLSPEDANLFFQLVSRKYEKTSIVITSNRNFKYWGSIFNDEVIAAAIIDILFHHSHLFVINGPSYRIKDKVVKEKLNLHPGLIIASVPGIFPINLIILPVPMGIASISSGSINFIKSAKPCGVIRAIMALNTACCFVSSGFGSSISYLSALAT
ncbi:MAG: hypothetical protein DRP54_03175 [Spirochaetes bacterium]|nr:MAG: hypothetical protein DRP54_03175 [Spirochaetota bacterium]